MIIGTGVDLIEISRIAKAAVNDRFRARVFSAVELLEAGNASHRLAGFFAAKEALLKAMGTGLAGFNWREIEIGHNPEGAPEIRPSGKVGSYLAEKKVARIHLSISHCKEYAMAQVVLETD
ncbi:MAG: holo-ACP synthase [Bacillota bacterium]